MFINGKKLLNAAPILEMTPNKVKYEGTSYGLAEAGYDIRIKQDISFHPEINKFGVRTKPSKILEFKKGNFVLASSIEKFQMPNNLVGFVSDKSTWARKGLSVFNTIIEPGWNGYLTLELVYHGQEDLVIRSGQGIAQVLFGELAESGDYGNGKYQNQEDRPINSIS